MTDERVLARGKVKRVEIKPLDTKTQTCAINTPPCPIRAISDITRQKIDEPKTWNRSYLERNPDAKAIKTVNRFRELWGKRHAARGSVGRG